MHGQQRRCDATWLADHALGLARSERSSAQCLDELVGYTVDRLLACDAVDRLSRTRGHDDPERDRAVELLLAAAKGASDEPVDRRYRRANSLIRGEREPGGGTPGADAPPAP